MAELLIAHNPAVDSKLPYLIHVPVDGGLVFRAKDTWPRTGAVYCHPVDAAEWPAEPELVERIALRSCVRRGKAIDIVADRARESRSQIVHTVARGRPMVFWQSPRTRKQARPTGRIPTARAAGLADWTIIVDSHERYPYKFTQQQVGTERRALRAGDYAVFAGDELLASVERKSLADLGSSLLNGKLRYAAAELSELPRAAIVVEDRYSTILKSEFVAPSAILEAVAELQVRYPNVPIVFAESRKLAEEWTFRFLGAALQWHADNDA